MALTRKLEKRIADTARSLAVWSSLTTEARLMRDHLEAAAQTDHCAHVAAEWRRRWHVASIALNDARRDIKLICPSY